jgi:outer membrane lipoprotein-sorting protein
MKRSLAYLLTAILALSCAIDAWGQEDVWARVKEVNIPQKTLSANWNRIYHSPMLQEDILSEGTVSLVQPDNLRWETLKPVNRVTVLDGAQPQGRFRLPQEKDFKVNVLEGDVYTIQLNPLRRDLKQLVGQIVLTVDKKNYKLLNVTILGTDGDWTQITFSNVKMDE